MWPARYCSNVASCLSPKPHHFAANPNVLIAAFKSGAYRQFVPVGPFLARGS